MKYERKFTKNYFFKYLLIPIITFIFLEIIFTNEYNVAKNGIEQLGKERLESRFVFESQDLTAATQLHLLEYITVLRSAQAFYNSSEIIERDEWKTYVKSLDIGINYPAISSLVFLKSVSEKEAPDYIDYIKSDLSLELENYPKYEIKELSDSKLHYFFHYFEPYDASIIKLGFDYSFDNKLKEAIDRARDTNSVSVSRPIVDLSSEEKDTIFYVVMPIYSFGSDSQRLIDRIDNFEGAIVAIVKSKDLFSQVIYSSQLNSLNSISVVDSSNEDEIILPNIDKTGSTFNTNEHKESDLVQITRFNIGGRNWIFKFFSNEQAEFFGFESFVPNMILIVGSIISFLISAFLYNSARLRISAQILAKELTKDLEKFMLAVENAYDQIVITDLDGVVAYANPATERITGYKYEEIKGQKAGKLWGGQMDKGFYDKMWQTIKVEKKDFKSELTNKRKNGELYYAEVTIAPVLSKDNEIMFFVAIERDITAEKQIEKIKDEFVSVASHELRTPLTAINGLVDMMIDGDYGKVNKGLVEPLNDVKVSGKRLIMLVNDLLSVSRIEAGRLNYELTEFDLKSVIDPEIELLSVVAKDRGLKLACEKIIDVKVFADKDKVSQTLNNLIGNALKFTKQGVINIITKQEGDLAYISISDSGVGIKAEDKNKLFNKFQQLDSGKMRQGGTGLGLYISKQMCKAMGGDLVLTSSEVGKGSTFTFSIPIAGSKLAKMVAAKKQKSDS